MFFCTFDTDIRIEIERQKKKNVNCFFITMLLYFLVINQSFFVKKETMTKMFGKMNLLNPTRIQGRNQEGNKRAQRATREHTFETMRRAGNAQWKCTHPRQERDVERNIRQTM